MTIPTPTPSPDRATPPLVEALTAFVAVARGLNTDGFLGTMTCAEADAFTGVLRAVGEHDLADALLAEHVAADDRAMGDQHDPEPYRAEQVPLPYLFDERVVGLTTGVTVRVNGVEHPGREVYAGGDDPVVQWRDVHGVWHTLGG